MIYVANIRFPTQKAHGVQIAENLTEFARQGVAVTLVVPNRRNPLTWLPAYRTGRPDLQVKPFSYYGLPEQKVVGLWTLDLVDFLKPIGFYIQHVTFAISAFLYILREPKDTIIYGRDELVFALIKIFTPVRRVYYELHDYPEKFLFFWHFLLTRLNGIISTNNWKKNELMRTYGIPSEKIIVARNGVDLVKFGIDESKEDLRRKLGLPLEATILGYVGQLKTMGVKKGVEEIVEAVEEIKKDFPEVHLKVVNNVPHSEIPKYLKAFDILLMPFPNTTHYAYYMSPIKMFEYMAAGKSIIATDLPSIREVLDDSSALFISDSSVVNITRAIRTLIENAKLRSDLGKRVRELALNYTLEKRTNNILSFINNHV